MFGPATCKTPHHIACDVCGNPFKKKPRKKDSDGLTSLIVEIDENEKTKRIYWVKNDDSVTEITSADVKMEYEASETKVDDNIFDVTTPLKRRRQDTTDDDYVPSSSEEDNKKEVIAGRTIKGTPQKQKDSDLKIAADQKPSTTSKDGKHYMDEEGYVYYQHSTSAFRRQLKCVFANLVKFKCQAKASMALYPPGSPIYLSSNSVRHNHPPENEKTLSSKFAKRLKQRVLEEPDLSVKEIYEEECEKCPPGAKVLPENIALQRMRRYRREFKQCTKKESELPEPDPPSEDENPGASTELKLFGEGKVIYVDSKGYQYHQQFASVHKRPTDLQISVLLEFIEEHPVLVSGLLLNDKKGRHFLNSLWKELKNQLNSIEGPSKSIEQWQKYWTKYQLKAKRSAAFLSRTVIEESAEGTHNLSEYESRVDSMSKIAVDLTADLEKAESFHTYCKRPIESDVDVYVTEVVTKPEVVATPEDVTTGKASSTSKVKAKGFETVSKVQRGITVTFMEHHLSLRNIDVNTFEETAGSEELGQWQKLVSFLNTYGPERSDADWRKVWRHMKLSALAKRDAAKTLDEIDTRVIACLEKSVSTTLVERQSQQPTNSINRLRNFCKAGSDTPSRSWSKRRCSKVREDQKIALINYLEEHKAILANAKHNNSCKGRLYKMMWAELATLLNSLPGPKKSVSKWQICFTEFKFAVRKKLRAIDAYHANTTENPGGCPPSLSRFEKRVLALIKYIEEDDTADDISIARYFHEGADNVTEESAAENDPTKACYPVETSNSVEEEVSKTVAVENPVKKSANNGKAVDRKALPVAINPCQLKTVDNSFTVADQSREILTGDQVDNMIEFIKSNPLCDLCKWNEDQTNPKLVPFWDYLSKKLNRLGPSKDADRWKKCWCVLKDSSYKKALLEQELSPFEQQILNFAKSKPVLVARKDQTEVVLMSSEEFFGDGQVEKESGEFNSVVDSDKANKTMSLQTQKRQGRYARHEGRMTYDQKEALIDFLMKNPKAQTTKFGFGVTKQEYSAAWNELAGILNSLGPPKTANKWQRAWTELKAQVRKKIKKNGRLTNMEENIFRMKYPLEETPKPVIMSSNQEDESYITVSMEDLQNAINQSIISGGGTEVVLTVEPSGHHEE